MTDSSEFDVEAQIIRTDDVQQGERNDILSKFMNNTKTVIICSLALLFFIGMSAIGNAYFYPLFAINPDQRSILMDSITSDASSFDYTVYLSELQGNLTSPDHFQAAHFLTPDQIAVIDERLHRNVELDRFMMSRLNENVITGADNNYEEIELVSGAGVVLISSNQVYISIRTSPYSNYQRAFLFESNLVADIKLRQWIGSDEQIRKTSSASFGKSRHDQIHNFLSEFTSDFTIIPGKVAIYEGGLMARNYHNVQNMNSQAQTVEDNPHNVTMN